MYWLKYTSPITVIAWLMVLGCVFLWGRRDACVAHGGQIVEWECVKTGLGTKPPVGLE